MTIIDPLLAAVALIMAATMAGVVGAIAVQSAQRRGQRHGPRRPPDAAAGPSWNEALSKTRGSLARRLVDAWQGAADSDRWLADAEETLLIADVGVKATRTILEEIRSHLRTVRNAAELRVLLRRTIGEVLGEQGGELQPDAKPWVILVVGVNGVGKTTTIGKLAFLHRQAGRKVLLVAADTFRAAAVEQLALWAGRSGASIVKHQHGADPSAVAFDGMKAAIARDADIVLVDTAGRLHVKENLMEELRKIARTIGRQIDGAPHEVLLVVDATTGQNALSQARAFHAMLGITGVALAKLDGTAKGGIALAIRSEFGLPIRFVGLGERPQDLAPFEREAFIDALFSSDASDDPPLEPPTASL